MKKIRVVIGILALVCALFAIIFVLMHKSALLTHPKGIIADREWDLIKTNILLMLIIVVPTFIALFLVVWRYRSKNSKATFDPEKSYGFFGELILWVIPTLVIVVMVFITWDATHELDPYKPLNSDKKPLTIQVIALDWKWLFIYPEQGIASVNYVQFPEQTPIHFDLSADGSPMNSFWMPQLSGQIYAMSGMVTPLNILAYESGEYTGRAAEINGKGFADMTFVVKTSSEREFDEWVGQVKQAPLQLTDSAYSALARPSEKNPIAFYSSVEKNLFNKIVMKY